MNINNIKNFLRAYFVENWRRDLIWGFGLSFICMLLMFLSEPTEFIAPKIYMAAYVLVYPSKLFESLHHQTKSIHYLMIPVNNREKVVANMFLANIYNVVLVMVAFFLSYVFAYAILKFTGENFSMFKYLNVSNWGEYIFYSYVALSVMFFGNIYFKKKASWSTIGVVFLIFFVFNMLMLLILMLNVKLSTSLTFANVSYSFGINSIHNSISYILGSVGIIFFYVMSFLRMRETEA